MVFTFLVVPTKSTNNNLNPAVQNVFMNSTALEKEQIREVNS